MTKAQICIMISIVVYLVAMGILTPYYGVSIKCIT